MMKNLRVGKKILVGFAVVIAMLVLMLALTTLTSLTRSNDMKRVSTISDLQREANTLLENFLLARVEIRSVFTSVEAESEYYLAMDYLDACEANLGNMDAFSAQLDGYMGDTIGELEAMLTQVRSQITTVGDNDELVLAAIDGMQQTGSAMSAASAELFQNVTEISLGIFDEDSTQGLDRIVNVVLPTTTLGDTVDNVRVNSRGLMLKQDVSGVDALYAGLDDVKAQSAEIRATLSTDSARASIDTMTTAVDGFRSSVEEAVSIIAASDAAIVEARTTFLDLNTKVNECVETISAEVNKLNDGVVNTSTLTTFILLGVGVLTVAFAILIALLLGRIITRPLGKMQAVMTQAGATGNLDFSEEVRSDVLKEASAKDELGQSLKAFAQFVDRMVYMAGCLKQVANRDLTVEVDLLSDEDTMAIALQTMVENLNEMFGEINSIASQVATSANEIAMGAQGLAQGSTEQASTVEEISASINEINEQMNTSNQTADEAATEGLNISRIAKEGNEKMQQMTGAMHEINEASQSIGNVIKVIDDIAFQTNILALNAAVEAARAGEHGKGFAVVADEVRNLAGKSADAAKETSALISTNIEKTEMGLTYTEETAQNLSRIIEGIDQTSNSLQLVASQSESAKAATEQVTLAVDQVAQVVQQNSATSEESAAASQEMSSQAQVLQQLIARFKLKNSAEGPMAELPPRGGAAEAPQPQPTTGEPIF